MSNPITFMNNYVAAINSLINSINSVNAYNAQIGSDSSLFSNYFATPGHRTDITATDAAEAFQAAQNMVTAYNATGQGGLANANFSYLVKMTQP